MLQAGIFTSYRQFMKDGHFLEAYHWDGSFKDLQFMVTKIYPGIHIRFPFSDEDTAWVIINENHVNYQLSHSGWIIRSNGIHQIWTDSEYQAYSSTLITRLKQGGS